ncbi:MAG: hypothetical protein WD941_01805 [Opitutus sp.]
MNSSDQPPKVPLWVFFTTDLALIAAAGFIASRSSHPLSPAAMLAIVVCVIAGAIVALVPLVTHFERQKNEQLDERQRALEALAQTVSSSAEQISIAAGGLHEIAELAQRNLRQAEQLPHKLQEKIAEFQAQLANAGDAGKEELERELETLRSSETERLETVADKLARTAAELTKLEAATHQHLSATSEAIGKLSQGTAVAIGRAQAAAEQALTQARVEAARQLGEAAGQHARSLDHAARAAVAALETGHAGAGTAVAGRIAREPAPISADKFTEVAPVAPKTAEPFSTPGKTADAPAVDSAGGPTAPQQVAAAARVERKRAPRKAAPPPGSDLNLGDGESAAPETARGERVLSSDGATRVIATAYIGIGNRLFIRGEGPGLSWDKGVPLQFVSIGKWRWETSEAATPVRFKLYKNDEHECASLGSLSLEPGHQQEVTAAFS